MAMKPRKKLQIILVLLGVVAILYLATRSRVEGFTDETTVPTFHVMIATGGRETLKRMLNSLKSELLEGDAVTVIFDGRERFNKSGYSDEWIEGFRCKVNIIVQEENTGYWGHPIRNKHVSQLTPRTTFIMNADDDDAYYPGSFDKLRKACTKPDTLYIAKMNYDSDESRTLPIRNDIIEGEIGNPNGIIPYDKAPLGTWENHYTGDFKYYNSLREHIRDIEYLDTIIYRVR
jgi:hypothetical protein